MGVALDGPQENEQTIAVDDLEILVGDDVKPYAVGNVLDWVTAFGGDGFIIQPANGQSCC